MTHLIIWVAGGLNFQTRDNTAAELAGLVNAIGTPQEQKVYTCTNLFGGGTMYITVDSIIAFQDVTG